MHMDEMPKKENLFFLAALFALLFSGEVLWWQAHQTNLEIEGYGAAISTLSVRDTEAAQLKRLDDELMLLDMNADAEFQVLEQDLMTE